LDVFGLNAVIGEANKEILTELEVVTIVFESETVKTIGIWSVELLDIAFASKH